MQAVNRSYWDYGQYKQRIAHSCMHCDDRSVAVKGTAYGRMRR